MTAAEARQLQGGRKRSKYGNQKTERGFDSKREERRFGELELLERQGEIKKLRRQVPFALAVNRMPIATYIADFVYVDRRGVEVVEDAKGVRTPEYRIKKKLMRALHGIEIVEV